MEKLQAKLWQKIEDFKYRPFLISDFLDLANYETIKKSIQRLEGQGKITRLMRGMYCVPFYNQTLKKNVTSRVSDIAYALARQNHWTICPDVDQCMSMVGLSTQVPATYRFLSTGPYRMYSIKGTNVVFLHAADKYVSPRFSNETMILIQAIRGSKKKHFTKEEILEMRSVYQNVDLDKIGQEATYTSPWIYETIKKVCDKSYV